MCSLSGRLNRITNRRRYPYVHTTEVNAEISPKNERTAASERSGWRLPGPLELNDVAQS